LKAKNSLCSLWPDWEKSNLVAIWTLLYNDSYRTS
jgi:hypothetical protein